MSLRLALAASLALVVAAPALAQEAPPAPAAVEAPGTQMPSDEFMAAAARIAESGERIDALMAELEPRAAALRADAALSDADRETRIRAMIAEHQPTFDAFVADLSELVRLSALAEGAPPEAAAAAAEAAPAEVMAIIEEALITGESDHADEAGDHAAH